MNTYISEAEFGQELADMAAEITLQRLLAGDERQATSEFLRHEMTGLPELVLVGLRDEVLRNKLASRNASNSDRPLDHGQDNLKSKLMNTRMIKG